MYYKHLIESLIKAITILFVSIFLMVSQTRAQDDTINFLTTEMVRFRESSYLKDMHKLAQMNNTTITVEDSNVTLLGRWAWGPCHAVEVEGNYAYISNGGLLQVLDISIPADPQIAAEILVEGFFDIDIAGGYAYLAGNHTLTIIDISTQTYPIEVGNLHITTASRVIVTGSYAYVGDFPGLLHIVDVSDPTEPCEVSTQKVFGEQVVGIGIYKNYAYVTTANGMVMNIIDISDPHNPQPEEYYFTGGAGGDIAVDGHYLYLGTTSSPQLRILDITDPDDPEYIGGLVTYDYSLPFCIKVVENHAYLSLICSGVSIVDVSDVMAPEEVGFVNWTGPNYVGPIGITMNMNHIYVAAFTGLWVIDASSPTDPFEVAFFPTGGSTEQVAAEGNIVYVADGHAGLWVVDFADPANPENLGHLDTDGFVYDIAVVDGYAYLLHLSGIYPGSLWIVDVTDPSNPSEMGQLSIDGNGLAVSGDNAFVTVFESALVIVDVSEPTNPYQVGICSLTDRPKDVAVWGNHAYVGTSSNGLRIVDVSDPSNPVEISSYFEGAVTQIAVAENLAYVPYHGKLRILDVSIPTQPCVIGSTGALFYQYPPDITVSGGYVYMTFVSLDDGLQIIDVASPENPVLAGYVRGWSGGHGVTISNEHIYWGLECGGVFVLRNDLLTSTDEQFDQKAPVLSTMVQNYPNPFNKNTTIEYQITEDCLVEISVYNVLGQQVAVLVDEFQRRGKHKVDFYANDFASGVYFYRLKTDNSIQIKKALLVQ